MKLPLRGTMVLAAAWLAVIALAWLAVPMLRTTSVDDELAGILTPQAIDIEPFELVDEQGLPFTRDGLGGRWTFVFFGYTFCPDICPTTLAALTSTLRELDAVGIGAGDVHVVFVSVDPERDTAEHLARYLDFFAGELRAKFTGVTGPPDAIAALARQFGAMYRKEEPETSGGYFVSHTGSIFLTSPRAELVAVIPPPHQPPALAELFGRIRAAI